MLLFALCAFSLPNVQLSIGPKPSGSPRRGNRRAVDFCSIFFFFSAATRCFQTLHKALGLFASLLSNDTMILIKTDWFLEKAGAGRQIARAVYSGSEGGFVNTRSAEVRKQTRWAKHWPPLTAMAQLNETTIFTSTHNFSSRKHKTDAGNRENGPKSLLLLLPKQLDAVRHWGEQPKRHLHTGSKHPHKLSG